MYEKEVDLKKLSKFASNESPNIHYFKNEDRIKGYVDADGLIKGNDLEKLEIDDSILNTENPIEELCKYLLDNDYELFFNLGIVEDLSEYNITDKGKFEINYLLNVKIDAENDFNGYTNGHYGVFVKRIFDKYQKDDGYVAETMSIVKFLQPDRKFYHLDEIQSEDKLKNTFKKLIDKEDIYII